jgi:hypothetical protein
LIKEEVGSSIDNMPVVEICPSASSQTTVLMLR